MPLFVAQKLFEPLLPLSYLPVLRELDWFDGLCEELRTHPASSGIEDPRVAQLHRSHEELVKQGAQLLGPRSLVSRVDAVQSFASGVHLTAHYERTVLSSPVVDTHGSATLLAFAPDVRSSVETQSLLREATKRAFSLSVEDQAEIDEVLAAELAQLELCHDLIDAMDVALGLQQGTPEVVLAAFTALYGPNPLEAGEVDVIRTGSSLFFCIPYTETRLDSDVERDADAQAEVARFLTEVAAFHQVQMGHFPVFGTFRAENALPDLLAKLGNAVNRPHAEVTRALTSMVCILRSAEVDKYIVHDAWGHQWQSQLLPFEEDFQRIASFEAFPDVHSEKRTPAGDTVTLADMVAQWSSESTADFWDPWLRGAMAGRLLVGVSALVAEMLADVVEYKFIATRPELAGEMESSSHFKTWPTKLDLTLLDLRVFGRMALKSFYRLVHEREAADALVAQLQGALPEVEYVPDAVEQLRQRMALLLDTLYAPRFAYEPTTEGVKLNKFSRLALNLLSLHSALNTVYRQLESADQAYPEAMSDFRDLLVLASAAFYQRDPATNFWHIDEFLATWFPDLLQGLLTELDSQ